MSYEELKEACSGSAANITRALKIYGGDDMESGIEKMEKENRERGCQECRETEVQKAHDDGILEGIIIGSVATVCVTATIYAGKKLVGYIKGKIHTHKAKKHAPKESEDNE